MQANFLGGLYFGGYPQPQDSPADTLAGCRVTGPPSCYWGWDERVNAFSEAKSAAGLRQLLAIFAPPCRQLTAGKPAATAK